MRKVLSLDALVLSSSALMCERNILTPEYLRELLTRAASQMGFIITETELELAIRPLRRVYYSDYCKRRTLL